MDVISDKYSNVKICRFYTSESDVCRSQILTYKDGPRTVGNKNFIITVDPLHRYSNEADRTD